MDKIFSVVKDVLTKEEIHFDLNEANDVFSFGFKTDAGIVRVKLVIDEEKEWFVVVGNFPNNIPVKFVDKLYPIFNKLNRASLFTSWLVDPNDGEVQLRWGATVDEGAINEEMVKVAMYGVVQNINSECENIMKEIYA
ncbi:type III secretion system chaperone family protein [Bacteroides thetaiotaomicron]|jgi:hypothetical protein|uniref:hypothetical protein n=1 Tax=Bacteroides thetaiotaomicron TaxID=818 RepID=UPI00189B0668|nr:hypothetical protein [Bacteroides thetaiotaomicron]